LGADFPTYLGNEERTSSLSADPVLNVTTVPFLHPLWRFNAGRSVIPQPIEQNGVVFFGGTSGYEYAVYASNGTLIWKTFLGQDTNDSACGLLGVSSTATAIGSDLYVDGGYPYFYALNSSTGTVEWRVGIGGTAAQGFYDWSSPLIYNGNAYVGISSDCDSPLVPAGVEEISLTTHAQDGYFNSSVPASQGSSIWGSPSVNPETNTIFVTTGNAPGTSRTSYDESILALNATTLAVDAQWQVPPGAVNGDSDFGVTPTLFTPVGGYPMVTAANKNGILYAFYQSNLTLAWDQPICCQVAQDEHISAAWGGGHVYAVGSDTTIGGVSFNSSVSAFDPNTGALVWEDGFSQSSYYGYAAPTWVNGLLIVPDQRSLIVLNANTGAVLYQGTVGGNFNAAASVSRGEIFGGTSDGGVTAFDVSLSSTMTQSDPYGPTPLMDSFNVSVVGGLPRYQLTWHFGDGGIATGSTANHTYTVPGIYNASVTVTDLAGAVSTTFLTVTAGPSNYYPLTFTESGLPMGMGWSLMYDGAPFSSMTPNISLDAPNGTEAFSVSAESGYSVEPLSGVVTVAGTSINVTVSFSPQIRTSHLLTFTMSGLGPGTPWSVTLNGSVESSTNSSIQFIAPDGNYPYQVGSVAGYEVSPPSGIERITGSNLSQSVAFVQTPGTLIFTESGLPISSSWSVRLNGAGYTSNTPNLVFQEPSGTYLYKVEPLSGFSSVPSSGTIVMNGTAQNVHVTFAADFQVAFRETGLPVGTSWSASLASVKHSSTNATILFSESNATYSYFVGTVTGFARTPASGTTTVSGGNQIVNVVFTAVYAVTFTESGLPIGTSWTVNLGGLKESSSAGTILFSEPNGTYSYTITTVPGHGAITPSGSVAVVGGPKAILASFITQYLITFRETGLPPSTTWTSTLGGVKHSSPTSTIQFWEANGTSSYFVGTLAGYTRNPVSGTFTVAGGNQTINVVFTAVYAVTFSESSLPIGTSWTVNLGGLKESSSTGTLLFSEPNRTYSFTVTNPPGFGAVQPSGTVTVNGGPQAVFVTFVAAFAVTFHATGLPAGTSWASTLGGIKHTSTSSSIVFSEPNGSYSYFVGTVAGYARNPVSGSVAVVGANLTVNVVFTESESAKHLDGRVWTQIPAPGDVRVEPFPGQIAALPPPQIRTQSLVVGGLDVRLLMWLG